MKIPFSINNDSRYGSEKTASNSKKKKQEYSMNDYTKNDDSKFSIHKDLSINSQNETDIHLSDFKFNDDLNPSSTKIKAEIIYKNVEPVPIIKKDKQNESSLFDISKFGSDNKSAKHQSCFKDINYSDEKINNKISEEKEEQTHLNDQQQAPSERSQANSSWAKSKNNDGDSRRKEVENKEVRDIDKLLNKHSFDVGNISFKI